MASRATIFICVAFSLSACFSLPAFAADEARALVCTNSPLTKATMMITSVGLASLSADRLEALAKSKKGMPEGHVALRVLGERYQTGNGVGQDLSKAADLYRQAAFVFPSMRAVYIPGFGNIPGSTTTFSDGGGIMPGDLVAMSHLARMYLDGEGIKIDPDNGQALLNCAKKLATEMTATASVPESPYFDRFKQPSTTPVPTAPSELLDREIRKFPFASDISAIAWSLDGEFLAVSYDEDRKITLLDAWSGNRAWTAKKLVGNTPSMRALIFSPDGTQIYTPSAITFARQNADKTVSVIRVKDGHIGETLGYQAPDQGQARAKAIAASRDGARLYVVPYTEGNVITYDTRSWNIEKIYTISAERVAGKSPNQVHLIIDENKDILWVSHSGLVREVRLSDGNELSNFQTFEMTIARMELNARSGDIVVGGTSMVSEARQPNGEFKIYRDDPATLVRAYDPQSGRQTRTYLGAGGSVMGLSIIADGSLIAASKSRIISTSPSYVLLWDAKNGSLLASKEYGQSRVGDVAFSPNGSALAYVVDNVVHLVKLENPTIAGSKK